MGVGIDCIGNSKSNCHTIVNSIYKQIHVKLNTPKFCGKFDINVCLLLADYPSAAPEFTPGF